MSRFLSALAVLVALSAATIAPAIAQAASSSAPPAVSSLDALEAQKVVRAQLAAFAADDAERAFSYASASIRQMFGTAAQFLRMVRSTYPVVYRPAGVTFLKPQLETDVLVQPVHMTDQAGSTWLALYTLQRQDDKSWRIAGCVLVPRAGQTV